VAAFHYAFPADALLQAFKYGGKLALAPLLAAPLAEAAAAVPAPDLLIPMPLHPRRLRERGFNQAAEIAKWVARERALPLDAAGCQRTRDTRAQAGLDWKERRRNVRGAFACKEKMDGLRVAVVDDVMTTGATLAEVARVLRRAGAAEVQAWVVARTRPE
jgi:ComF family protein